MWFFKELFLYYSVVATDIQETNCQSVYDKLYPLGLEEINLICSGLAPACHVTENGAASCFSKNSCPSGFTFSEFTSEIEAFSQNACQSKLRTIGYACLPYILECDYRENSNLYVNLTVKTDSEEVSLIPFNDFVENERFPENSSCTVSVIDGLAEFKNINSERCGNFFSKCGMFDFQGGAYLTQNFVAGAKFSNEYMVKFFLQCAVVEDHLAISANIIGEHINTEINDEIEAKFSLAMYRDPNFTIPFEDGEKVDIGPDADIQKIYVRGQAEDIKAAFDG